LVSSRTNLGLIETTEQAASIWSRFLGKRNCLVRKSIGITLAIALCTIAHAPAEARPSSGPTVYDGSWHLVFTTRKGTCDPSYDFNVNIANGIISHPNLVRFQGKVMPGGAVRASVAVQDKFASGSGKLTPTSGGGNWRGYSGAARCSGSWNARKQ
jgi:hypothetical protein